MYIYPCGIIPNCVCYPHFIVTTHTFSLIRIRENTLSHLDTITISTCYEINESVIIAIDNFVVISRDAVQIS